MRITRKKIRQVFARKSNTFFEMVTLKTKPASGYPISSYSLFAANMCDGRNKARRPPLAKSQRCFVRHLHPASPRGYRHAYRSATLSFGGTTPAGAIALHSVDYFASAGIVTERNQHLVQDNFIQDLAAALLQRFGETSRRVAVPLDKIREAGTS
jgi:hypothetical protein